MRSLRLLAILPLLLAAACAEGPDSTSPGAATTPPPPASAEDMRQEARAAKVEIIRDDFGVAHIYGATDADAVLRLASEGGGTLYAQPLEFLQNTIDWSLEDRGLMAIRSRAQFARTLEPLERSGQLFWESLNYGLALLGLVFVWFWRRWVRQSEQVRYRSILAEV